VAAAGTGRMSACQQITPRAGRPSDRACLSDLQAAAILGLQLHALDAGTERDVDRAFATLGPTAGQRAWNGQRSTFNCRRDVWLHFQLRNEFIY
jgi:hypothetical protein